MFPWEKEASIESEAKNNTANRENQARWRAHHAEEHRQRVRENLKNNPNYLQEWREKNPDKVKEYSLRQNDTEGRKAYMREYMREYRKKNADPNRPAKPKGRPRKNKDV